MQAAEENGEFTYIPPSTVDDADTDRPAGQAVSAELILDTTSSSALDTDHVNPQMVSVHFFCIYNFCEAVFGWERCDNLYVHVRGYFDMCLCVTSVYFSYFPSFRCIVFLRVLAFTGDKCKKLNSLKQSNGDTAYITQLKQQN